MCENKEINECENMRNDAKVGHKPDITSKTTDAIRRKFILFGDNDTKQII